MPVWRRRWCAGRLFRCGRRSGTRLRTGTAAGKRLDPAWRGRIARNFPYQTWKPNSDRSPGPAVKKQVNIEPTRLQQRETPASLAASAIPSTNLAPSFSRSEWISTYLVRLEVAQSVARPAAIARGLPESVPAWYTGPTGASLSMRSGSPVRPDRNPPPMIFPWSSGRADSVKRLRPAQGDAKAGRHLVENQQRFSAA